MSPKHRRRRAQALVETALILPVLVLLMLGSADLGRAFYLKLEMSGASRAGMRMAVLGQVVDIGNAVRSEPNSAIPNTAAAWGSMAPGGTYANCTTASSTQQCGDPNGCVAGSVTGWGGTNQQACFAVHTCANWTNGVCASWSGWGVRPNAGADQAVDVLVVYRFLPATPLIANFTGGTGSFYLAADTMGLQLY
jgi:Flp pilus assembly protein TadG